MERTRPRTVALLVASLAALVALLATACGATDDEAAGDGDGIITVNWGTEPPSLDPGLATDTTSSNIITTAATRCATRSACGRSTTGRSRSG